MFLKIVDYRVEQSRDVDNFRHVEDEVVVDDFGKGRRRHEIRRRLFLRRQPKKREEGFPVNVAQNGANVRVWKFRWNQIGNFFSLVTKVWKVVVL